MENTERSGSQCCWPGGETLISFNHVRRGLLCKIPLLNYTVAAVVKNALESSLIHHGARAFNALPKEVRRLNLEMNSFKSVLDDFLRKVPDKPLLSNYYQPSASNSIVDQVRFVPPE